mmetsp:Transcript_16243/g.36543  ORF Transcript_16243/g.36543 Transcript_16243/m.36543 type:complete len:244 (+) Transcript_16243:573-1304(+)
MGTFFVQDLLLVGNLIQASVLLLGKHHFFKEGLEAGVELVELLGKGVGRGEDHLVGHLHVGFHFKEHVRDDGLEIVLEGGVQFDASMQFGLQFFAFFLFPTGLLELLLCVRKVLVQAVNGLLRLYQLSFHDLQTPLFVFLHFHMRARHIIQVLRHLHHARLQLSYFFLVAIRQNLAIFFQIHHLLHQFLHPFLCLFHFLFLFTTCLHQLLLQGGHLPLQPTYILLSRRFHLFVYLTRLCQALR